MSSLVQPKWTSSVEVLAEPAMPARRGLMKYSTALTSCTVTALDLGQFGDLVGAELRDDVRAAAPARRR